MHKKQYLLLFLTVISWSVYAQVLKRTIAPGKEVIDASGRVTAVAIYSRVYLGGSVQVSVSGKTITIPQDPDAPQYTYFISLVAPVIKDQLEIDLPETVDIYLINSGHSPEMDYSKYRIEQQDCSFTFQAVAQSEWRAGLPSPAYTRSFTAVTHVVVHHSAGSNSSTNYTQVVRDIYLLHTQVNGWSDIGYNYLIAQDGTIYTGRDPAGGEQDNVLGAHFCGSNSGTMGVCLLGDYMTADPSTATWDALQQITAYKMEKENLDPLEAYAHAFGELPAIIGHRDGCSTLCPGENVYEQLGELRISADLILQECEPETARQLQFSATDLSPEAYQRVIFTNESTGYEYYKWIFEGGDPDTAYWAGKGEVMYNFSGIFGVILVGYTNVGSDTLTYKNIIHVMGGVMVFPNPVTRNESITLATDQDILEIQLIGLDGKAHPITGTDKTYQIPSIRKGIYLLLVKIGSRTYSTKLLIR